ncbi:MAG TPA: translational GTPase TypA [Myxococcota bacterium]|jgi:GTP-binding protein
MDTTTPDARKPRSELRNVAIIAHVDHGKTTLVDGLFRFTGALRANQVLQERAMDSNDLERERGITILAKQTSIEYEGVRIQIVDTPGHSDFGGEVERVLGMVDAVLLLVDAVDGVMPQTRFVLRKALEHGLRPIVVVNKIDRPEARGDAIVDEVFDLLVDLGATDAQLEFPVVFCSAKQMVAGLDLKEPMKDLRPLLETILKHAQPPLVDLAGPMQFQAVTLGYDEFLGRLVIGRVIRGRLARGVPVARIPEHGKPESFRITKLFVTKGLERVETELAQAGDIAILAGIDNVEIGDTVADPSDLTPLPRIAIDPPTIRVKFAVNTSPFSGKEGRFLTSRQIGERLEREALTNVSVRLEPSDSSETFQVAGRGELQIGILIETLRREGYEFSVSRPEIIPREVDGQLCEPVEDVIAEVPEQYAGAVLEGLAIRKGRMLDMEPQGSRTWLHFAVPSRGLFGYRGQFLTATRGEGVLHRTIRGYEPYAGPLPGRGVGAIVVSEPGKTTPYSLFHIQERSTLFVGSGVPVYEGQVVGENARAGDLIVNVVRAKKLTNIRAAGRDENTILSTPRQLTIESALEWIEEDELLEVTPQSLRLRKRILASNLRKR